MAPRRIPETIILRFLRVNSMTGTDDVKPLVLARPAERAIRQP